MEENTGSTQVLTSKSTLVLLQKCFRPLGLTLPLFAIPTQLLTLLTLPVFPEGKNILTTQKEKNQDISEK
jgi:hypothetical protein